MTMTMMSFQACAKGGYRSRMKEGQTLQEESLKDTRSCVFYQSGRRADSNAEEKGFCNVGCGIAKLLY